MIATLFILAQATAAAPTPAALPPMPAFMTGCWEQNAGAKWTQECWMEPRAGLMLGASREGTGEKVEIWEQARIERAADGTIAFYASPRGVPPVRFPAKSISASSVEFLSTEHDYPQRIRYWLKDGKLEAEVSLADGTKPERWSYQREGSAAPTK